ncbi:iron chelate uptake ABC transporter family permease subunit [Vibrio sp.]|nr:iron chelate uptake ABC transporter family permease subunit [Vibrio sp.]
MITLINNESTPLLCQCCNPEQSFIPFFFAYLVFGGVVASNIAWSSFSLSFNDVWQVLLGNPQEMQQYVIQELRMPRALSALVLGANLAIAGVLMQGISKNSLASPSVLGINAGATCLVAIGSISTGLMSEIPTTILAAVGGTVSGALVISIGGFFGKKQNPIRLVLAGIAINALLISFTRAAVILADDNAYSVINWLAGSLSSVGWDQWNTLWPISLAGMVAAAFILRQLNLLHLGEDIAISLGLNISFTRIFGCIAIILLTSVSVATAGAIGFIGLIIPRLARRLIGVEFYSQTVISALLGANLLVWSDALSRGIAFPAETPVGVITALIGTPCFIFFALKAKV